MGPLTCCKTFSGDIMDVEKDLAGWLAVQHEEYEWFAVEKMSSNAVMIMKQDILNPAHMTQVIIITLIVLFECGDTGGGGSESIG